MYFDDRQIVIDESLDPELNPRKEGRYRFTLAHEGGGHWRLHRYLFERRADQGSLFNGVTAPSVICRSSQAKERAEWQADFYASCLLMPRDLLVLAWQEHFGSAKPRLVRFEKGLIIPPDLNDDIAVRFRRWRQRQEDSALDEFTRPFAERFLVSMVAMRIRFEQIGLLHREFPRQRSLSLEGCDFFEETVKCQLNRESITARFVTFRLLQFRPQMVKSLPHSHILKPCAQRAEAWLFRLFH
jgi:Zn-dependent peptidase ImmA (M78 family)